MPTDHFSDSSVFTLSTLSNNEDYRLFLSENPKGLRLIPESHGHNRKQCLAPDSGDFYKWLRTHEPNIPISLPEGHPKLVLHSAEIWLPLVFLASDTSFQIFLNIVANYLYDRSKGLLKHESNVIHFAAIRENKKNGEILKLEFSGDSQDLAKLIKKFDANDFFK